MGCWSEQSAFDTVGESKINCAVLAVMRLWLKLSRYVECELNAVGDRHLGRGLRLVCPDREIFHLAAPQMR